MTTLSEPTSSTIEQFKSGKIGVYSDVPSDVYHALPAVSSGMLKRVLTDSPLHAKAVRDGLITPDSEAIDIGAAVHSLALTPQSFDREFISAKQCDDVVKTGDNAGAQCQNSGVKCINGSWLCGVHAKKYKSIPCDFAGSTVLKLDAYRRVKGIHSAIWADEKAAGILAAATDFELSVLWNDEDAGMLCKARFDIVCRELGILPDLKTCRSMRWFENDSYKAFYQVQMAHYRAGAIVNEIGADVIALIAVESDDPHDVWVPEIHQELLDEGIEQRARAMKIVAWCEHTGVWPGAGDGRAYLRKPERAIR